MGLRHRVREGRGDGLHRDPHRGRLRDLRLVEARWVPRLRLARVPRPRALLAGVPHRHSRRRRSPVHVARAVPALAALLAVEHREGGVGDARARDLRRRRRFRPPRARRRRALARDRAGRPRDGAAPRRAGGLRRARLRRARAQGAGEDLPRPAHTYRRTLLPAGRRRGPGGPYRVLPRRGEPHPGVGGDRADRDGGANGRGWFIVHADPLAHAAPFPARVRHRVLPAVPIRVQHHPGPDLRG